MLLSQFVEINEKGIVANAVSLNMIDHPEKNGSLCEGFILNYDSKKPTLSTVGILDVLRRSFHSRTEPNIHLIIQQYGRGKSHFAVAIANFFKQSYSSPEVEGILHQVKVASAKTSPAIAEGLEGYKRTVKNNHLVICLSGDRGGNIRKHFLQQLLKTLEEAGVKNTIAQHICSEPLKYLKGLDVNERQKAEKYLQSLEISQGDLSTIIKLLEENNPTVIQIVIDLAKEIARLTPDFSVDIDIEAILSDLIENLCSGENCRFQGILILFDELNYYLQSWAADQIGAGGTALQNITNICERYRGKISLLSFTQIHPDKAVGISENNRESYLKISTRLAPKDTTYDGLTSCLELVIGNLLIQKQTKLWQELKTRWDNTFLSEGRKTFEKVTRIYQEKGWSFEQFYEHISIGCFPLHPVTTYLLCYLDFTQDRTALQFIKGYVKTFIQEQSLESNSNLNYIYPISLVDTFSENFSNQPIYESYKKACKQVIGSENSDELITVLKALFLYYAAGERLTKPEREDHEDILSCLTGLNRSPLKIALNQLKEIHDLIYYRPEIKLYKFFEGVSPRGIEDEIEEKIKGKPSFITDVVVQANSDIKTYLGNETLVASEFVETNQLIGEDWQYEYKIYTINELEKALSSHLTLKNVSARGILTYVLAKTQEELQEFRKNVNKHLASSHHKNRIAIAIPNQETGDLDRVLLRITELKNKQPSEKRLMGIAYNRLMERWTEQFDTQLKNILTDCTYHCSQSDKIPSVAQNVPQRIISALLQELYPFVPPVAKVDKMRSGHSSGSQIAACVAQQLAADQFTPQGLPTQSFYRNTIDQVFCSCWKLFQKSSQKYVVQPPTEEHVRAAWDKISELTELKDKNEKIIELEKVWKALSEPPFGCNDYVFTVLIVSWMAYHRKEIVLKGASTVLVKKGSPVSILTLPLQDWANTDIFKKPKDFVEKWIVTHRAKLIRRERLTVPELLDSLIDYNKAQQHLQAITEFLNSGEADQTETSKLRQQQEQITNKVKEIDDGFAVIVEVEDLSKSTDLNSLLKLYPKFLPFSPSVQTSSDGISVQPTQEQQNRYTQAKQALFDKISKLVSDFREGSESLNTIEECDICINKAEEYIQKISEVSGLPEHLIETLQSAKNRSENSKLKLQEKAQTDESLKKIQELYQNLNQNSTQHDFTEAQSEIELIMISLPQTISLIEIQQIIKEINIKYQELNEQLDAWQEQLAVVTSPSEIVELIRKIESQANRFTEPESSSRIQYLQTQLTEELSVIQQQSDAEKILRSELSKVQDKLQRIRDLPFSKISEAFSVYQEITLSSLQTSHLEVSSLEQYQKQLEDIKSQSKITFLEKIKNSISNKLPRLDEYEKLKNRLNEITKILQKSEDFQEIQTDINQAIENLEVDYKDLTEEQEQLKIKDNDLKILQSIRQFKFDNNLNVFQCEERIKQIEKLKSELFYIQDHEVEIENHIQKLKQTILNHKANLEAQSNYLEKIDSLKEFKKLEENYIKLDIIFQQSNEYDNYQKTEKKFASRRSIIEQIERWDSEANRVTRLAELTKLLADIESFNSVENKELEDKIKSRIITTKENIRKKIRSLTLNLAEFENRLQSLSNIATAQQLLEEVLEISSLYLGSVQEERYKTLKNNIRQAIDILQITSSISHSTIKSCQECLDKLIGWKRTSDALTPITEELFDTFYQEIESTQNTLREHQQSQAFVWLEGLQQEVTKLYPLLDDTEKLQVANQLLAKIQNETSQYIEFLNSANQESLNLIKRQCQEEQNKDQANKIITMFCQLPLLQRQSIYEKLTQLLNIKLEETND
ncbi:hypothetical protein VB834_16840 [Limnoraphis robusta Tam1]|uniref:hypothetical protein n=1 Tax=Limnoraphis robusta TaxID=1118279 RepID=UPI002B2047CA|nr:hypothetical protein [Limnoraphis robusta]MEA5499189.1 hypothetical protein [Limnoraphis robusta BA-68 BA1]MEA5540690.1 hypothetical protein [Limnoraphis robusta Tam1]